MPLLTEAEAAIKLGYSIELLRYFTKKCPKRKDNRLLRFKIVETARLYDEADLLDYHHYLNQAWPFPSDKQRPTIPDPIRKDVKEESHHGCAICGSMDGGEIAHIQLSSKTMNNAPDNLIFLCPNHHTKYDYGFKVKSNITDEVVQAAKLMKKTSRQRMLRFEANTSRLFCSLMSTLKEIEKKIKTASDRLMIEVYTTELRKLTESLPELSAYALDQAKKDQELDEVDKVILGKIPKVALYASKSRIKKSDRDLRSAVSTVVAKTREILIDIDEVECPHCLGRGMTGLAGDICAYCKGSCVVTQEEADAYDRADIDEVECPHCLGRGTTGLVSDICAYCKGSCVVTQEEADAYDRADIDEVECPHCLGRGTTGLVSDVCSLCKGSCVVTNDMLRAYERKYGTNH